MNKALFLIGTIVLTTATRLTAQQDPKAESQRLLSLSQKLEGTYQVQIVNSREKAALPLAIMDSIHLKRHATETVYFPLKGNIRVMVLPQSEISKQGFKPLERIAYVSE